MALEGTIAILEKDLLPKEDLYKRWIGATPEEIAAHFEKGELQAYARYKGPINGVIWCKPGYISYRDCQDYLNPSLSEFHDEYCDYFLLQNVNQCESAHPEYLGNITPEGLGLGQPQYSIEAEGNPLHAGLATITADEAIKHLEITPIDLVDELNGYQIFNDEGRVIGYRRLVTVDEGDFREYADSGLNEPFFNMRSLSTVKIYKIELDRYCEKWEIQKRVVSDREDTSAIEHQLAEAQKHIEALEQWNRRLNEQNKKLRPELAEKDSRIAELESQLAISAENKGKKDNSAAIIGKLRKDLQRWKTAFPLAVCATEKLLTNPAETTKKTRSELLPFICEVCPSKCAEPKIPCAVFSKEQFEVWRDAVPPAHVDKSDKADKEDSLAHPLNTVETVGGEGNIEN